MKNLLYFLRFFFCIKSSSAFLFILFFSTLEVHSAIVRVAYIYGDISDNGTIPSGTAAAKDQMLLTDTGDKGCSIFKSIVEKEGYQIDQYYDRNTTLDAAFLNQFRVVIFGLHQKIWSAAEKTALDIWIRKGGGIMMYNDSAAGGSWQIVGADNSIGQKAVNNVSTAYGMQVAVDQSNGIRARQSSSKHPIVAGGLILEGEGVSPVAVDPVGGAEILVPFSTGIISGPATFKTTAGVTIKNPIWAALALKKVGTGNVILMFDRQPMWNNGIGSNIKQKDNALILKNVVKYLATSTFTAVNSIQQVSSEISIYPNPVTTVVNINFVDASTPKEIRIFNSLGQMVYSAKTFNDNAQINAQELKMKGIAVVQILNGNKLSNHKIQIK